MDDETEKMSLRERIGNWIFAAQTKAAISIYNFLNRMSRKLLSAMDYPEGRVAKLTAALSDKDADVRGRSAGHLGNAAELGVDVSAAMPTLTKMLSEELNLGGSSPSKNAEAALTRAVFNEKNRDAALSALANALYDGSPDTRKEAARLLRHAVERCRTTVQLDRITYWLRETYGGPGKRCAAKGRESAAGGFAAYRLIRHAAILKHALAAKRDIMLDDKPKPPGKDGGGPLYRASARLALRG
jgi:hypothetical protein